MTAPRNKRRGQPLLVYGLLIAGWIVVRTGFWDSPLPERTAQRDSVPTLAAKEDLHSPARPQHETRAMAGYDLQAQSATDLPSGHALLPELNPVERGPLAPVDRAPLAPQAPVAGSSMKQGKTSQQPFAAGEVAAGHQLLWLAAMARLPVPRDVAAAAGAQRQAVPNSWLPLARQRGQRRWSLDAWVFLREGSGAAPVAAGLQPSYGKSQQGAVVRYRLADAGGRAPTLYARYTRALAGARETDVAAGLSAKPFAGFPLTAHAEIRATRVAGSTELRPAAFVTTGVHRDVPLGFQVRGYAQAGWVGGDYATAFVDGQIVADREVAAFDLGKTRDGSLRVGGGAWGGAQRNAERLDAGPSASLVVPVADAPVRLSVDYRFRILGDAEPDSGVAVTLSTGF